MIRNHENKAPKQEAVEEKTILDLWPAEEKAQVDRNANMVANVRGDKAKVDFVLIQDVRVPMSTGTVKGCLLYTSPSPRDRQKSRMPSSA